MNEKSEKMARLTEEQRIFTIEEMLKTNSNVATRRKLRTKYDIKVSSKTILALMRKWKKNGTIKNLNKTNSGRRRSARTEETIENVKARITTGPSASLRKLAAETGLSKDSIHTILKKDLGLKPYKIQESQELLVGDQKTRLDFCKKVKSMIQSGELDPGNIIFSDESHVYLHSSPNKQNSRQWLAQKPDTRSSVPLHSQKVTVWCGFNSRKVFGPYFYEDSESGKAVTVTKERYTEMLAQIFPEDSEDVDSEAIFQQDGAPAHTSRMAMEFLSNRFPNRLISKNSDFMMWPPRSPDLNPLDFFFWGFMKQKVHEGSPRSLEEVKTLIEGFVNSIPEDMLQRVTTQFCSRISRCIQAKGGLFE